MSDSDLYNSRNGVFDYLATTSGVKFSTSATIDGFVRKDYVVVHEAPPVVVKFILANFKCVSLREGHGLMIQTGPSV